MEWQNLQISEVLKYFNVTKNGLDIVEVRAKRVKHGKNILSEEKKDGIFKKILTQLSDFMVLTLLAAAVISFVVSFINQNNDYIDSIIILTIVIINTFIGVLQESKAEKAIESLKKLAAPMTKVIRNGKIFKIPSEEIVPGDVLSLSSGDLVPADARIIESFDLETEESALTGESTSVHKNADLIFEKNSPVAEQKNMLFSTSSIILGHATAIAVETGMNTQVGKIAALLNKEEKKPTPLQNKLAAAGKITGISIFVASIVIFALGLLQGVDFLEMFMIAISLAVAAIPEGLPAVVTVVLASGVRRMAARNTIVRKLPAVETLGSATVICSDKTGTLTMNKMSVSEVRDIFGRDVFKNSFGKEILTYGALCNNTRLAKIIESDIMARGEPTENALVAASYEAGNRKKDLDKNFKRVNEIAFTAKRKIMTTIHKFSGGFKSITKGAPDVILSLCTHVKTESGIIPLNEELFDKITKINSEMAKKSLRVLAIAYKDNENNISLGNTEKELIFCGLVGLKDPARPEAAKAVAECKKAGIKAIMITGDHIDTAKAIAKEVGILTDKTKAMTGSELDKLSQKELEKIIGNYSVFARVSPEHKVKIVKAFQANGEVVAMTGDGVNDAPALKCADIGCAMGKSGTDVAKAASDMVITDDNFATVVTAVEQGRGMYENIRKTVHFLLSTNIGEVVIVLLAFLMRLPTPLLAIHLLWINLVTDSFPALALGMDSVSKNVMKRKPVSPKSSIFADGLGTKIILEGLFISAIGFLAYVIGRSFFDFDPANPIIGRTMAFATLGISQLIHAFNTQSEKSLFRTGIFKNIKLVYAVMFCIILQIVVVTLPIFTEFFRTQPMNLLQWLIVLSLSFLPILVAEGEKLAA